MADDELCAAHILNDLVERHKRDGKARPRWWFAGTVLDHQFVEWQYAQGFEQAREGLVATPDRDENHMTLPT
jgi:hypothetical protein